MGYAIPSDHHASAPRTREEPANPRHVSKFHRDETLKPTSRRRKLAASKLSTAERNRALALPSVARTPDGYIIVSDTQPAAGPVAFAGYQCGRCGYRAAAGTMDGTYCGQKTCPLGR